jgi:hypothetical protein
VPSDDRALTQEVTARWHELVRDLDYSDAGLERLRRVVIHGDRRVINVVRPHFLTRARLESERLAVALTANALRKVIGAVVDRPELLDEIGADAALRELVAIDPGVTDHIDVLDRYDAFATRGMRFVEVQGSAPGGPGYHDEEAAAFQQTAVHERLAGEYEIEPLLVVPPMLDALVATWREWGGSGDPAIAILDWDDAPLMFEFELIRDRFRARGIDTVICDPRALRFEGGRLRHGATAIDVVYRRLAIHDVVARPDDTAVLVEAMRAGAVCVVNPFVADLFGHKSVFDLLAAGAADVGLTGAESNAIRNHIPWTRRLAQAGARTDGATIALDAALAEDREKLVLKPSHDYGGRDVHLGWETDDEVWRSLLERYAGDDWILQRRIAAHREQYPLDEPGFPLRTFYVDTDPFTFRRRMGGVLTRLSVDGITNVTQGGSLLPAFVVGPQ